MSNVERRPPEWALECDASAKPVRLLSDGRDVLLGDETVVCRLLPEQHRRTIGAWCFVDHFGPDDVHASAGMRVPPHPHIGLQTVTWLVDGEVLHRDSLGTEQLIRPGQLNLMTSGAGIAHSEESPGEHPAVLHGAQLWIALPDPQRHGPAAFEHHGALPSAVDGSFRVTVLAGEVGGLRSPATVHSPLVGLELATEQAGALRLPLDRSYEHGAVMLAGSAVVDGASLGGCRLLYLGCGRDDVEVRTSGPARLLLLGGEPLRESLVMWWNFVGRTHEEIVEARADWEAGRRFAEVRGYPEERLAAPPLPPGRLQPRP